MFVGRGRWLIALAAELFTWAIDFAIEIAIFALLRLEIDLKRVVAIALDDVRVRFKISDSITRDRVSGFSTHSNLLVTPAADMH